MTYETLFSAPPAAQAGAEEKTRRGGRPPLDSVEVAGRLLSALVKGGLKGNVTLNLSEASRKLDDSPTVSALSRNPVLVEGINKALEAALGERRPEEDAMGKLWDEFHASALTRVQIKKGRAGRPPVATAGVEEIGRDPMLQDRRVQRELASVQRQRVIFRFDPSLVSGANPLAQQMELDRIEETLLDGSPGWPEAAPVELWLLLPEISSNALIRSGARVIEIVPQSGSSVLTEWGVALAAQRAYVHALSDSPNPSLIFTFPVDVELYQGVNRQRYQRFQESLAAAA